MHTRSSAIGFSFLVTLLAPAIVFAANDAPSITIIASDVQESKTVDAGTKNVKIFSLEMMAHCSGPATVRSITFVHKAPGAVADVMVSVATNGKVLSKKASFDPYALTATVNFDHILSIPACQKKTIDVLADFQNTWGTGVRHSIMIELPTDIQSDTATVSGNFPIMSRRIDVLDGDRHYCLVKANNASTAKMRWTLRRECRGTFAK